MSIEYLKEKLKCTKKLIENTFYYCAKLNGTFPYTTILLTVILIYTSCFPILLQLYHRINYLPKKQIQYLDTNYQPLNKINEGSIEDNINYNELLSFARNVGRNSNNFKVNSINKNEINNLKNKPIQELDINKLGRFISIIEHVTIDTMNIMDEYKSGRSQGVINKNTILQVWKIQNLLETTKIEIPSKYLFLNNNNTLYTNNNEPSKSSIEEDTIKVNLEYKNSIPKKTFSLSDICIKDENQRCIVHSPLVLWDYNITKLENEDNIIDTMTSFMHNNINKTLSFYSIFGGISFNSDGQIQSSNNIILTFFLESKNIPDTTLSTTNAWNLLYKYVLDNALGKEYQDINVKQYKISSISKELKYNSQSSDIIPSEYILLLFIYLLLYFYITSSIGKVQFVKSKYRLGFVAVISVSLSLVISIGFLEFLLGRNSSMFYSWSIFPYLVMTIGIESILLIVKSVVNTSIELPFTERYALGMKNISLELVFSLLVNILIISLGNFSKHIPIVDICFYTSVCIIFNFWLQIYLFGTALSLDIKKLELYDLYTIQSERNHRIIEQIGINNIKYNQIDGNKPYHPLLDVKNEEFSDFESNDDSLSNKNRKIRWNWTIVFIVMLILIFGSNINQEEEGMMKTYYYSDNYNMTYAYTRYGKYYMNDYPDIITSLSHILPKYWDFFKNQYNEKINVVDSALSSLGINHYVLINSLVHITIDADYVSLYEPDTKVFGFSFDSVHPSILYFILSFELLLVIFLCMLGSAGTYIWYSVLIEYSKRINSFLIHIIFYYFLPVYDYNNFFAKKYIIPLYQPFYLVKVNKEQLEMFQKKMNYKSAFSSTTDMHIINGSNYESIDYIIIKNPYQNPISSPYQDSYNIKDERAIVLWGGRHSSINIWSSDSLNEKSKGKNTNTGIYYYRNPFIAKKKYLEKENENDLYHFIDNYSTYINKPKYKCKIDNTQNIYDLSMDVFNDYVLMANKNILYQWEYYNKKINYFDIIKEKDDEILWILNSNEKLGNINEQVNSQYLNNQQYYDNKVGTQFVNGNEPYFITVVTKMGRIITLDENKNVIHTAESKEILNQYNYYHQNNNILMNELSQNDSQLTSNYNYDVGNTTTTNDPYHRSRLNNFNDYNANEEELMQTMFTKNIPLMNDIPACYHYDNLNRLWISLKNKIIICYKLPTLQPLFILNENDMNFITLSTVQSQGEAANSSNNNTYWSRHYRSYKHSNNDYDHYIYEKLFVSREYSKIMVSNEEIGWLVTSDATGYMSVWDTKEGKIWDNIKCPSPITNIHIIKSSSKKGVWWIASSHEDETVRLWATNAGILSCSEVWYQPGCSTIACHNSVIVGARRVCIREKTVAETFILQVFINIVLIVNVIVNLFIYRYNEDAINLLEMVYHILKQIYLNKNKNLLIKLFYTVRNVLAEIFHIHIAPSSSYSKSERRHHYHHHHRYHHYDDPNTDNIFSTSSATSSSPPTTTSTTNPDATKTTTTTTTNDHDHRKAHVWMWQIWLYNVDTEMNRYLNFSVDKLNGLGVPEDRVISMPRSNLLFQIFDLSVEEDVNGHPSFTSKFKSQFKETIGFSETQQTLHKYMKRLNVHELGSMYNEIPSDVNFEELGYSKNMKTFQEFFVDFPEHTTSKEIEEKERIIKKTYSQPPVLKINHININSRLICFDFGKQLRVLSFKNTTKKRNMFNTKKQES